VIEENVGNNHKGGKDTMFVGFIVPTETSYNSMYGELGRKDGMMAVSCIGQCTGCTCACRCSCKAIDDIGFKW